jgi:arsenite methyltransferase
MSHTATPVFTDPETSVRNRYSAAARHVDPALCCPVEYAADYLTAVPDEILAKDYGCGDPTPYGRTGGTFLDLGACAGKLCYILAQVVGVHGRVIGVDCNPDMLALARKYTGEVAERLGYANVEFRYGLIQDLALDLDQLNAVLRQQAVSDAAGWLALRATADRLRAESPLVPDDSIDCVVSNCVVNLVPPQDRRQLFAEVFRVLKRGGRAAISDIVSDEEVPAHLRADPEHWSGCLSGAFREDRFLQAFEEAGFHGIHIAQRQRSPWRTVEGIEFRSITVVAYKGKQGPCLERNQAVVYRGPFRTVEDDDGHAYFRGERMAVCDKTYHLLQQAPYAGMFDAIEPRREIPLEEALAFDCRRSARRDPRETKGNDYAATGDSLGSCCGDNGACC